MLAIKNKDWWKKAIVYQIYPQSFQDSNGDGVGDIPGITSRLSYLKNLGINVIWLNPIYVSPEVDNGYDIANYREINPKYGSMSDYEELVKQAHKLGIKILMDLVVNHTSDQNKWFQESKKSKNNPFRDYYFWRDPVNGHEPNDWGSYFGGSAWKFDESTGQYYLHLFAEGQPDLNWGNPKVQEEVREVMKFWLDKGADGFRMDVINMISKPQGLPNMTKLPNSKYSAPGYGIVNGPKLNEYLKMLNRDVLSKYSTMTVGEMPQSTPNQALEYTGFNSNELNMVFQFDHVELSPNSDKRLGKWNDEPINLLELKDVFSKWEETLDGKGWNSLYWNNHDQPRAVSRFGNDSSKYREVSAKMLGTALHMMQGTPYIYEGEELGMANANFSKLSQYEDIESINSYDELVNQNHVLRSQKMLKYLSHMSRDNARTPMQWNDKKNAGFTTGRPWFALNPDYKTVNVELEKSNDSSVLNYYKKLVSLRKNNDVIVYGDFEMLGKNDESLFSYKRHYAGKTLLVITNFTDKTVERNFDLKGYKELIGNYNDDKLNMIRPYEAKVYLK